MHKTIIMKSARKYSRTPKKASKRVDIYQKVTNKMIAKLEEGTAPWRCSWNELGMAKNYVGGNVYWGINAILLNIFPKFEVPYYLTYKQAEALGGNVRKGAVSEKVYFFKAYHKDQDGKSVSESVASELRAGGASVRTIPFLKSFSVFNVADVEGVDFDIPAAAEHEHPANERCENLLRQLVYPPKFVNEDDNGAWYAPARDTLNMPKLGRFDTAEDYYSILFHELTHATGHVTRLNREGITGRVKQRSEIYAKEELTAEMGAAFLRAHTGINVPEVFDNSAAYIASWLKHLRNDKTLVFKAAAQAQKAADYLLNVEA